MMDAWIRMQDKKRVLELTEMIYAKLGRKFDASMYENCGQSTLNNLIHFVNKYKSLAVQS